MSSGEANIIEFISSLEEYSGAIPDQVIEYYLQRTGFSSQDIKVYEIQSLIITSLQETFNRYRCTEICE